MLSLQGLGHSLVGDLAGRSGNDTMADHTMVAGQKLRGGRGRSNQGQTQESLEIKFYLKFSIFLLKVLVVPSFCCEALTRLMSLQSSWTYIQKWSSLFCSVAVTPVGRWWR